MSACPNLATLPSMRPHLNVRDSRGSASCLVALCPVTSHAPHHPRLCQTSRTTAANYHAIVVHLADSALLTIRCKLQKLNSCPGISTPMNMITSFACLLRMNLLLPYVAVMARWCFLATQLILVPGCLACHAFPPPRCSDCCFHC